jgi:hypothetical protein
MVEFAIGKIGMNSEMDVLRDISAKFAEARVPYMLTGSMAMNFYALPRMTRDIDVVVALHAAQIETILRVFGADYYVAREAVAGSIEHESMFNLIHNESLVKVDCIVCKRSEYRLAEFQRRKEVLMDGFASFVVSKEDLIISKLYWAKDSRSEQQLRDIKNLIVTGYDPAYLEHWTRKLDLHTLWVECLHD